MYRSDELAVRQAEETANMVADQTATIRGMFGGRYRVRSVKAVAARINESPARAVARLRAIGGTFSHTGERTGKDYWKLPVASPASTGPQPAPYLEDSGDNDADDPDFDG